MNIFKYLLVTVFTILSLNTSAQSINEGKSQIDFKDLPNWKVKPRRPEISADGKFLIYNKIENSEKQILLMSVDGKFKKIIKNSFNGSFLNSGSDFIYLTKDNELIVSNIEGQKFKYDQIKSFELHQNVKQEFAICKLSKKADLGVVIFSTGKMEVFTDVNEFLLSPDKTALLLQGDLGLRLVDLKTGHELKITNEKDVSGMLFSSDANKIAFSVNRAGQQSSIWCYDRSKTSLATCIGEHSMNFPKGFSIPPLNANDCRFSHDGKLLFFNVKSGKRISNPTDSVKLSLWSYTDTWLQSQQAKFDPVEINGTIFPAIISLAEGNFYYGKKGQKLAEFFGNTILAITNKQIGGFTSNEGQFNITESGYVHKVDLVNKKETVFSDNLFNPSTKTSYFSEAPNSSKYQPLQDTTGNLWLLDRSTGRITETLKLSSIQTNNKFIFLDYLSSPTNDPIFFVFDGYDIWKINAEKNQAVNVTNGYGRAKNYKFYLLRDSYGQVVKLNGALVFKSVNCTTWENSFAVFDHKGNNNPTFFSAGKFNLDRTILKASGSNSFIFRKESDNDMGNFYLTTNFTSFSAVTDIHPENAYKWYNSEIINFKRIDGKADQAILYKPNDFDSNKRYPVIMLYYDTGAIQNLAFGYHIPEMMYTGEVDIPWFVSRGYLVCRVNNLEQNGWKFESAYQSVVGAAEHLKKLGFVNPAKMALSGHSFGGGQTDYIIGQTNIFCAALSGAGTVNLTSQYSALRGGLNSIGVSNQGFYEWGQFQMRQSLWENPAKYVFGSPIFYADKVETPLLMMHNDMDGTVKFDQGIQFYSALRRLGKKVWLLCYEGEGHTIRKIPQQVDFTIRTTQFFDFYLKDLPAPIWMLDGIPFSKKGIEYGLQLDSTGRKPGQGIITDKEMQKIEEFSKIPFIEKLKIN